MNPLTIVELVVRIALSDLSAVVENVSNLQQVCRRFKAFLVIENITEKRESEHGIFSYIIGTDIRHGTYMSLSSSAYRCSEFVFGLRHGPSVTIYESGELITNQYKRNKKISGMETTF
jgi:hypothetical protein